ncbi:MAG: GNAT family N-acetyltransferase, partial [Myxococcota bacterium]
GRVAGYCLGWLARNPPIYSVSTVGFISELAVRAEDRRRGVGTALIGSARGWFDARGVTEFQLATAVWNDRAQSFWAGLGGRPILTRFRFEV